MEQEKGIPIKKPKSIWAKPVKLKLKLFKSLFNTFKDAILNNWTKIPADVIDTISGIELNTSIGTQGWPLVTRALTDAMVKLVDEHKERINIKAVVYDHLDKQLNEILESQEHYIGFDFFEKPGKMILLELIQPVYCEFLQDVGFEISMAQNICNRLTGYFVLALRDEWRKNPDYYQQLLKGIKTPFDKEGQKKKEWLHYLAWIKKQVEESVFSETFSLEQTYVPLRAYYKKEVKSKESIEEEMYKNAIGTEKYKKIAIDLEKELMKWLEKADKDDALRIIAGGPGYGKSSFLKIFAAKLAEKNIRSLFIPLHSFEIEEGLKNALQNFIQYNPYLTHDPLGHERLVIIFDGLDELTMPGKGLANAASHFIEEVKKKLMNYNSEKTLVQVIISGRDIIIQVNEVEFSKDKQIFYILPYYIKEDNREEYIDKEGILKEDQRDTWWKKYGELKIKEYGGLPKDLKNEDLDKLTAIPLLNYLVALSYERGKINFSKKPNLNEIYEDLLEAVYSRDWEKGRRYKTFEHLDYNDFEQILEEIAISTWHRDDRKTTINEIEKYCKNSGLERILNYFKMSAEEGMICFLSSFYFRKTDQDKFANSEKTFEFTHKSFGEFLVAKRIVKKIQQIHRKRIEREKSFGDEGWNIINCLVEWIKLFGPNEIDRDLLKFISNEIETLYQRDKVELKGIQETIIKMINYMLENAMPMESLDNRQSYYFENVQAINSEKALLIILSTIANYTKKIAEITWPGNNSFGEWISRMQGQRTGEENFVFKFLNHLDLKNAILMIKDLYGANFKGADIRRANLIFSNLMSSNFKGTYLDGAYLKRANLKEADLEGAFLRKADLSGVDLSGADLSGANLKGANLKGAILRGADLIGADLSRADLKRADLTAANLKKANLKGAKVTKEQLKNTNIDGTTLLPLGSSEEPYVSKTKKTEINDDLV